MRPAVKLFLRRELVRAQRARDEEAITLIQTVINDGDVLDLVWEGVQADYEYKTGPIQGTVADLIGNILAFMVEHREEILKLISLIVKVLA